MGETATKTATRRITIALLASKDACSDAVKKFAREWPDGGEVTVANVLRAHEIGLDLRWAAEHLLSAEARAEYDRVTAPAFVAGWERDSQREGVPE